ncbi:segregation and condensation protein B [Actinokineospora baliensis]|uniref:SMC-Scp complex subunit ScpB n=1 Tax=Actinokineospora baliensis TaxID=547056 RepID=UPI0019561969|nr:SMC-Scp complex subunit ScpB [Actinokineospora baliensis]MBM7773018.1 segregation and condensation protein B [Actinokineospora baliensis]
MADDKTPTDSELGVVVISDTPVHPAVEHPVGEEPLGGGAGAEEPAAVDHVIVDSAEAGQAGADPAVVRDHPEAEGDQGDQGATGAEGEPDADLVQTGAGFPDLTEDADFEAALEALLLVVDSPAEEELLATATEQPVRRVREALRRIAGRYTEAGSGIDLRRVGEGWRLFTRDRFAPVVEKLLLDGQRAKLTRAALETLAVIAYRQPVTRSRVAAVRGVNVDGVIRTLVVRGLIEETGTDPETGGILYRTTELFLERLGLSSLEDLPPIAPLLPEVDAIDDVN